MKHILTFVLLLTVPQISLGEFQAPVIRLKLGMIPTMVSAGELIVGDQPLNSMMTIQPSVLWDFASMNSRLGFHYVLDLNSQFGATPISGIGFSGYYYLTGLSSAYESLPDDTLIQKYRPGFYTFASFTPVNFNLNRIDTANAGNNFSFSAVIFEIMLGMGYEYPLRPNTLLSIELASREGSVAQEERTVRYSGLGIFFSFTTSYY